MKLVIIGLVGLFVTMLAAIIGGAVYIGQLEERVSSLESDKDYSSIQTLRDEAIKNISLKLETSKKVLFAEQSKIVASLKKDLANYPKVEEKILTRLGKIETSLSDVEESVDELLSYRKTVHADTVKGIMWQIIGIEKMNWKQAISHCKKNLELGGYKNWRLPNLDELKSAYQNRSVFPKGNSFAFWSTPFSGTNTKLRWYIDFSTGNTDLAKISAIKHVRCVRNIN